MDNVGTPEQLAASIQQMRQYMQQMQQTIATQKLAAHQEPPVPIEATMEPGAIDSTTETETSEENQQVVSYVNGQGWLFKNYHPNPNVRNNPHLFSYKTNPDNPNDRSQGNQQNNPQAASATASGPSDELKGMMQQLLQGNMEHSLGKHTITPEDCNAVELRSGKHLPDPASKKLTAKEKGKQKEGEQPLLEDVLDDE
ncbi:hypothetical protein DY000_02015778 [Brassica cretica]|uniref:Uncharacterized protein n=1 Tax=Brassica cretica TaxID=69181 RepID=A0ABQ7CRU4_BRACR|nr:hypothetical protein DY000_02015778 [Brassica cretica]